MQGAIMQSVDKTSVQENLARAVWLLSEYYGPVCDITGLAQKIAKETECDWAPIRDDIVAGLISLSDGSCCQGPGPELSCIGHCEIGSSCYWWHTGAETSWSDERPEWWDEQIEQWSN